MMSVTLGATFYRVTILTVGLGTFFTFSGFIISVPSELTVFNTSLFTFDVGPESWGITRGTFVLGISDTSLTGVITVITFFVLSVHPESFRTWFDTFSFV